MFSALDRRFIEAIPKDMDIHVQLVVMGGTIMVLLYFSIETYLIRLKD